MINGGPHCLLLHYRTTQRAVETGKPLWWIGAALTTVATFMFQLIFYALPGVDGESLVLWQQILFSSVVPVGIIFMVWHHQENAEAEERDLIKELMTAQANASDLQEQLNEAQKSAGEAQITSNGAQERAIEAQQCADAAQSELKQTQLIMDAQQAEIKQLQDQLNKMQLDLDQLQEVEKLWQGLNRKVQSAARVNLGVLSVAEAVAASDVTENTIRSAMKYINGHR